MQRYSKSPRPNPEEQERRRRQSKEAPRRDQTRRMWTMRGLAHHWSVNYWTVRRWIETGRLKSLRFSDHTIRIADDERQRFEREAAR